MNGSCLYLLWNMINLYLSFVLHAWYESLFEPNIADLATSALQGLTTIADGSTIA